MPRKSRPAEASPPTEPRGRPREHRRGTRLRPISARIGLAGHAPPASPSLAHPTRVRARPWSAQHQLWAALGLALLVRLPGLMWPVISDDEAIYDTMAQVVQHGGAMYVDTVDHKPPGLVYTYSALQAAGAWLVGTPLGTHARMAIVHLAGALAAMGTAAALAASARTWLPAQQAWIPAALYALVTVARCPYDGLAVNGELLMNLPTAWAAWAVLRGGRARPRQQWAADLLAGALMGLAGLVKWQALVVGLAFPWLMPELRLRPLLRRGLAWLLGLALPLGTALAYFYGQGALLAAWQWGLVFNLLYINDGPVLGYAAGRLGLQILGIVLPGALLYGGALAGLRRGADPAPVPRGVLVWAGLAAVCVSLGGRFFGHYFLQLELPLCLLAAAPVARLAHRAPRRVAAAALVPALAFGVFALAPRLTRAVFDPQDPDWARIGQQLQQMTAADDSLFVWGNAPLLYAYADRQASTRFVFCNYLTGLSPGTPSETDPSLMPSTELSGAWAMLFDDLRDRPPTWILDTAIAGWKGYEKFPLHRYPALNSFVARHYVEHARLDGAVVYRRRPDRPAPI